MRTRYRLALLGVVSALGAIEPSSAQEVVLPVSDHPEYVHQGLALGLDSENPRPTIIINLSAARAEGADFSAELLKIVQVVGQ